MKQLSQVLENISHTATEPDARQSTSSHGLTNVAGTTNTQLAIRPAQLTEKQLTAIASHVLRQPLSIICEEKTTYGKKTVSDEYGARVVDNVPIGTTKQIDVIVDLMPDASSDYLAAALRVSPPEAVVKHLTHLSMHKKFGSGDGDRAVMLSDYVAALRDYPEFVVYSVCRHYWENDRRPFVPYIDEIKDACDIIIEALKRTQSKPVAAPAKMEPETPKVDRKERSKAQWSDEDWRAWIEDAEAMINTAKVSNGAFDPAAWEAEADRRRKEWGEAKASRIMAG